MRLFGKIKDGSIFIVNADKATLDCFCDNVFLDTLK